jgi:hypothetical protein
MAGAPTAVPDTWSWTQPASSWSIGTVRVLEHYTREGTLDCLIEGTTATAVSGEAIQRRLLTQLGHAGYLGRELRPSHGRWRRA